MQESAPKKLDPCLLIDASLADRPLADALHLVDYNAIACSKQFSGGTPDPTIIQWLALQNGIWITADEKAKRKHSDEIQKAGINIIWVHRPKDGMNKKAQLLLLLWIIDPILDEIMKSKGTAYFLAKYSGARPKWERL
ncbi:hypothetical protein ACFLXO_08130 [Chloroflexota bacterium]